MFGLSKKIGQSKDTEIDSNLNIENEESMTDSEEDFINQALSGSEPSVLKDGIPEWERNLHWVDDISWSKVLMSDSENLRQGNTINRQKDSAMVVLVRRLEYFPNAETINNVRGLFQKELNRLNSVRDAMNFDDVQQNEQNPILTQAGIELASELNKIKIEQDAFERKVAGEVEIINNLVNTIEDNGKPRAQVIALLHLYDFGEDNEGRIYHISTPSPAHLEQLEVIQANESHLLTGEGVNSTETAEKNQQDSAKSFDSEENTTSYKKRKVAETIQNIGSNVEEMQPFSYLFGNSASNGEDKSSIASKTKPKRVQLSEEAGDDY